MKLNRSLVTSLTVYLFVIAGLVTCLPQLGASADENTDLLMAEGEWVGERVYPAMFESTTIPPYLLASLKRFDLLAFAPGQDTYISMVLSPEVPDKRRQLLDAGRGRVPVGFHYGMSSHKARFLHEYVGGPQESVYAYRASAIEKAVVLVSDGSNGDWLAAPEYRATVADLPVSVRAELAEVAGLPADGCHIVRVVDGFTVQKTFVRIPRSAAVPRGPGKEQVACAMRGMYMHLGLGNIEHVPSKYLVRISPIRNTWVVQDNNRVRVPAPQLFTGAMAGKSREEVLTFFLTYLEQRYAR